MDGTLVYNVENLRALAQELSSHLSSFEGSIGEMFNVIDVTLNSSEYWQGQTYDQFKLYCDNYRSSNIEPLIEELKKWISDIESAAERAEATTARNVGLF
ncbi:MAG: hypothetical protein IJ475_02970 [Bacilli bacterium]|nr:hypothetical protein [Bacilli bacterium]